MAATKARLMAICVRILRINLSTAARSPRGCNPPGQRVRGANQIRREECGQRGYSHCDGIKKTARDAQRLTQRSDNEREFANLRQAHPDAHRCAAILPGGESAQTAGKNFSE